MNRKAFPHFCIEQIFSLEDMETLHHVVITENPAGDPLASPFEAGTDVDLLWEPGQILSVTFMNGDPIIQNKVVSYATQWSRYANITFDFVNDPNAEIRISFMEVGTWSTVGRKARLKAKSEPTMNFDDLYPDSSDANYSHYVLHEFGHALGLEHEHQSPHGDIQWNRQAVINDLSSYWDLPTIERNIFKRFKDTNTQFTRFDPKSIMIYEIPSNWTLNTKTFLRNYTLSQTDKDFIRACYPF